VAIDQKAYKRQDVRGLAPFDTRQHILTCAARLFRKLGYAAVSLRDVASEASVTTGSLYHHFGSKDELVRALLEQGYEQILREVQAALETAHAQDSLRATLLAALTAHLTCLLAPDSLPAANVRIFAHVPESLRHATLKGRRNYEKFWIDLLRTFSSEGFVRGELEPKALVMILFGAMNWSLEWFKPGRDHPENLAADLLLLIEASTAAARI
jgi:TetR/AcrR family transcriptional regulator, cholesterol catabolism regulator